MTEQNTASINAITYARTNWLVFTSLNYEEDRNLKKIYNYLAVRNGRCNKKAVYCIETRETFKSLNACAKHFGVSAAAIFQCIQRKSRLKKIYSFERITK